MNDVAFLLEKKICLPEKVAFYECFIYNIIYLLTQNEFLYICFLQE